MLKYSEQEFISEEEPLKPELKSAEPKESKVEQESVVMNDSNPPTPISIMDEATKESHTVEPYTGPIDFYKRA